MKSEGPARDAQSSAPLRAGPRALVLIGLLCATLLALLHGARLGVAVPVSAPQGERIDCLSYAPFRRPGETPFDPRAFVDEARIESDLRVLRGRTDCVRTYAVSQGLDAVPRVAQHLGMTVQLGAWLGRDRQANASELERAIAVARAHPQTVSAVVVGNEVMLRGELPPAELLAHLRQVREAVPMPVTYADVWEFWMRYPALAQAVTFVTIHALPYWEDEPVGIEVAVDHVVAVWHRMRGVFPELEIRIGETGWPSAGRARRDAVPGRIEQARFVREFTRAAAAHGIRYNLIEGFDQPWKRRLEGAMGGAWGLFDSQARPKFPWHGPVAAREGWTAWRTAGLLGAVLGAIAFGLAGRGRGRAIHAVIGTLAGAGIGALLAEHAHRSIVWNRDAIEWLATGVAGATAVAASLAAALLVARRWGGHAGLTLPTAADTLAAWRRDRARPGLADTVALLHAGVLFAAALTGVLHAFDARYRGFDWTLLAGPAVAVLLMRCAGIRRAPGALEERALALILAASAVVMVIAERPTNPQALAYAGLLLVLAWSGWDRASTSTESKAPTAAGS